MTGNVKIPLRYQISEYDCGPTSLLNGVSYLFEREEIPAELVRDVMLYSMDTFGDDGTPGVSGTTQKTMRFLSRRLDDVGRAGRPALACRYITGREVDLESGGLLADTLRRGGAAVVHIDLEIWHYILLTGLDGENVYAFDPYRLPVDPFPVKEVTAVESEPFRYNRIVPRRLMAGEVRRPYALGPFKTREAVLLTKRETAG